MKEEGTTPQSAAADSSPYMLQPQAACEGGAKEGTTPQSAAADSSPYTGEPKEGEPLSPLRRTAPLIQGSRRRGQPLSLLRQPAPLTFFAPTQLFELRRCCGRLIFRKEYTVLFSPKRSTFSRKRPAKGEPKEGTTPQFAAADSSPYILRTEIAFQAIPVLRSAYFPKRVHRTLFSKTLDLQPLCGLRRGEPKEGTTCQSGSCEDENEKGGG